MAMRVLITGGAGFLGSHLAERLLADGHRVTLLDDLSTGRRENLEAALATGRCELHVASAADPHVVGPLVQGSDLVFHLAAIVGVRLVVERPAEALDNNLRAARTVLQAAARWQRPVVFASSSEVYGKGMRVPFREDDDLLLGATTVARWSYAAGKATSEWLALGLCKEQGMRALILRLFNTVGPRQRGCYGMVLPRFVRQALRGEPITVHGDGRQTRCFAHVADVVDAIVRLVASEACWGQVVNVGSDEEIAVGDLARIVRSKADSRSPIVTVPYEVAYGGGYEDLRRRVPDLSKLRALIGKYAPRPIESIVEDVLANADALPAEATS
jgi:UDP-glucose 4-epimerase